MRPTRLQGTRWEARANAMRSLIMTLLIVMVAGVPQTGGGSPAPPTSTPGGIITIKGGPGATANIPGPHNDPADFFGIVLALAAIVVVIGLTRLIFRTRRDSGPRSTGPEEPPAAGPAPEEPGRS